MSPLPVYILHFPFVFPQYCLGQTSPLNANDQEWTNHYTHAAGQLPYWKMYQYVLQKLDSCTYAVIRHSRSQAKGTEPIGVALYHVVITVTAAVCHLVTRMCEGGGGSLLTNSQHQFNSVHCKHYKNPPPLSFTLLQEPSFTLLPWSWHTQKAVSGGSFHNYPLENSTSNVHVKLH